MNPTVAPVGTPEVEPETWAQKTYKMYDHNPDADPVTDEVLTLLKLSDVHVILPLTTEEDTIVAEADRARDLLADQYLDVVVRYVKEPFCWRLDVSNLGVPVQLEGDEY